MKLNQRIIYLDFLKLMSALMVVFYHFGHLNYGESNFEIFFPNFNYIFMTLSAVSIPLFFMVNGALILNRDYTYKKIINKIFKLFLIIFVWKFIRFPAWFLKTLIILYALYPIFKILYDKYFKITLLMLGMLFIFPFLYNLVVVLFKFLNVSSVIRLPFVGGVVLSSLPRTGFFTMYSILFFHLGAISEKKQIKLSKLTCFMLIVFGLCECLFETTVMSNYTHTIYDNVNTCFPTIGALLMALGFFHLVKTIKFSDGLKKILINIQPFILSIYLFHMMIIRWSYNFSFMNSKFTLIISLSISILICLLTVVIGKIISIIPYLKELIKI